jgi:hypothetical protein
MMILPFYVIIACLPLIVFFDDDASVGVLLLALSVAIATSRRLVPATRMNLFQSLLIPLLCFLAVPACYMVFQMLPLSAVSHPAWASAASALNMRLSGAVTLDKGVTFLMLARYCAFCGLLVLTMIVAMTHSRAERTLVAILSSVTLTLTVFLLVRYHALSNWNGAGRVMLYGADAGFLACLGLILSLILAMQLGEDFLKPKRNDAEATWQRLLLGGSISISLFSLISVSKAPPLIAFGIACASLLFVTLVRRLGIWAGGALAATALIVIVLLTGNNASIVSTMDSTLRFGSQPAADSATVQRMLDDLPTFGTGAGTFDKLYQLYGVGDVDSDRVIASTPFSAVLAIEIGKPAFWGVVASLFAAVVFFLTCGVLRGRDWIYPAACAALLSCAIPLCFETPLRGHLNTFALSAVILGLGLAQSLSRHMDQ